MQKNFKIHLENMVSKMSQKDVSIPQGGCPKSQCPNTVVRVPSRLWKSGDCQKGESSLAGRAVSGFLL